MNNSNQYIMPKEIITINTVKNKTNMTINSSKIEKDMNTNEYISFSPSIITKKNTLSLSPVDNKDGIKVQSELDQLISFFPERNDNNEIMNNYISNKNSDQNNSMLISKPNKVSKKDMIIFVSNVFCEEEDDIQNDFIINSFKKMWNNIKNK